MDKMLKKKLLTGYWGFKPNSIEEDTYICIVNTYTGIKTCVKCTLHTPQTSRLKRGGGNLRGGDRVGK